MSLIFEMILRSSLVVAIGLAALWLLRKQSAALRHWVVAGALVLAAAQPALNSVMPSWRMPAMTSNAVDLDGPALTATTLPMDSMVAAAAPEGQAFNWRRAMTMVWLAGATASLALLVLGAAWLRWLGSRAAPAPERWTSTASAIQLHLSLRRPVRVLVTSHPALLVTWGVVSPVILLPAGADSWAADRIKLVLAHEMAHLARRDWLIQLGAELIRAVNWFNPLFWLACARLRRESEHASDDMVLELGIRGASYASHLVDLARAFSTHGRTWLPAPSIARPSTLERRVRAMLNPQVDRRPVSVMRRAALAASLLAIAVPIAAAARAQNSPSGTIQDPSGRPLADAEVRLAGINGEPAHDTRTDATGRFQLPEVPAGDYLLSVRSPGFSTQRQRVSLKGGGVTFSLRLPVGTLRETITVKGPGSAAGDGPRSVATAPPYTAPACAASDAGGRLIPPRKLRDVRPRYRQAWAGQGLTGTVLMQATIDTKGIVRGVEVVSPSNAELEEEAIAAVSLWEFSPTYLNCEPVEVRMFVTVNFALE